MANLKVISLNCNGLRKFPRRKLIFDYLIQQNADVIFLQETHCDVFKMAKSWARELPFKCYWSLGHKSTAGVAILIKNVLAKNVHSFKYDLDGRIINVNLKLNDNICQLLNVYCPNEPSVRRKFIDSLNHWIKEDCVILGGDFNCVENLDLDKDGGRAKYGDYGSKELYNLKNRFELIDAFRHINPNTKEFTWGNNETKVRLDRIYVSKMLIDNDLKCSHLTSIYSDHNMCILNISEPNVILTKGRGLWKCNESVLNDKEMCNDMKVLWAEMTEDAVKDEKWWDNCKNKCKLLIIEHSKKLAREERDKEKELTDRIKKLTFLQNREGFDNRDEILELKEELGLLFKKKMEGQRIRAKMECLENEEKVSDYYIRKKKGRNSFKKLETNEGVFTKQEDILSKVRDYYVKLFSKEAIDDSKADMFLKNVKSLSEEEKLLCEGNITEEEVFEAVSQMSNEKSPGSDGLPAEFYKKFIHLFVKDYLYVMNTCKINGSLTESQKLATITLLCKDNDKAEFIQNWRPISLLNVDYKIVSKIMSIRLSKVLEKLVNIDQTCNIKGRSINDNLHLLRNVCDYVNQKQIECAILSLDQVKAFDRVAYSFLFKVLDACNFGEDFKQWICMLYNDVKSQVIIDGNVSEMFNVNRGVRQGCSLSPLLYVLFIEPLAESLRQCSHIKGLKLPGTREEAKVSQYADDIVIFITDFHSGMYVFKVINQFCMATGSALNKDKSWGIWLGKWKDRLDKPYGINWTADCKKILGLCFGNDVSDDVIWQPVLEKMEKQAQLDKCRNLTFKAKANIIKACFGSKVWYTGAILSLSKVFASKLQHCIFRFFWDGAPDRVNRETMYMSREDGGFDIVNIRLKVSALQIKHVISIVKSTAKWTFLAKYWCGMSLKHLDSSLASNNKPHCLIMSDFYYQVINVFKTLNIQGDKGKDLTTKAIYSSLCKKYKVFPIVLNKFPQIDFIQGWKNVHNPIVDPDHRDLSWRIMHRIIGVNEVYHYRSVSARKCNMCAVTVETVNHCFILCTFVWNLWDFLEKVMTQYTGKQIEINGRLIIFNNFEPSVCSDDDRMLLLCVSIARKCIWTCRNAAKFENEKISNLYIICRFIALVKFKIKIDQNMLSSAKFKSFWGKNDVFISPNGEEYVFNLKPP